MRALKHVLRGARRLSSSSPIPEPRSVPQSKLADNFLDGTNASYLEQLENQWRADPNSVHPSWSSFLQVVERGKPLEELAEEYSQSQSGNVVPVNDEGKQLATQTIQESMRLLLLVRAYQVNGHMLAELDPLGLLERKPPAELDPALYGFTEEDLDREFFIGTWRMHGFLSEDRETKTLRQILDRLKETYCGHVGFEYMHIYDRDKCNWLRNKIETPGSAEMTKGRRKAILHRLAWSDGFENFLNSKYSAAKRFGIEGCETLIPGIEELIDRGAQLGAESFVLGMGHRGRLNVLANVVQKPLSLIFSEFKGGGAPSDDGSYAGSGDVKYHLGTSCDRESASGHNVHVSLVANPSHLEAVDTVVQGKTRAKQHYSSDDDRNRIIPVLIHGDGSFCGQGVVYESFDMSALPDYTVGGTIHIVVNNQVAFTTDPKYSRSSTYCTDVAKTLDAPIFHVNGDDVEAVVKTFELAIEWRQRWNNDVVVDIMCYRKYGHNEMDEPSFTQPLLYKTIKQHPNAHQQYADRLVDENVLSGEDAKQVNKNVRKTLEEKFENAKDYTPKTRDWLSSHWEGFHSPDQLSRIRNTGVPLETLKEIGRPTTTIPDDFSPHRQIRKVFDQRKRMVEGEEDVDWATAEMLAFATLVNEGNHVRVSGQDSERGTFSQRHAVIHDQETGKRFKPLSRVYEGQPYDQFTISNSSLSEFGVVGFEHGFSLENPNSLVCWEAQFGDFVNGAQVIIDQFIASGEAKWLRQSGLAMLLPHGYDGQGPEHSSCRMERFLQLCDEDPSVVPEMDMQQRYQIQNTNLQVCNATTPANYFHLLRRQVHRDFRKPLVVATPKNLLRHPKAKSPLSDFDDEEANAFMQGVRFKRLIMDKNSASREPHSDPPPDEAAQRLIFCSGKVYYELDAERGSEKESEVKICRVEQLAPFPFDLAMRELRRFPNAQVVWCQEEPHNMGAWTHVKERLRTAMREIGRDDDVEYVGRNTSSSPATGFHGQHSSEQEALVTEAIHGKG